MFVAKTRADRIAPSAPRSCVRIRSLSLVAVAVGLSALACGTAAAEDPPKIESPTVAGAVELPAGVQRLEEAPPPELPEPAPLPATDDVRPEQPIRPRRSPPKARDFTDVVTVINDDGTIRRVTTVLGKPLDGQSLEPRRDPPDAPPRAKLSARSADDDAPIATPAAAPVDDGSGWLVAGAIGACLVLGIVVLVLRK